MVDVSRPTNKQLTRYVSGIIIEPVDDQTECRVANQTIYRSAARVQSFFFVIGSHKILNSKYTC